MRARIRKAFTLVEILIVVVILGILAAIVVPQFTRATEEAQGGNVMSQMDTLNNQIELWKARHNGKLPTDTAGTFSDTLVGYGWSTMIKLDAADPDQGGYIKAPPVNPITKSSTVVADFTVGEGWVWKADINGVERLWACEFDHTAKRATPGQPGNE
jgi:general secretion pathway protein G